MQNNTIDSGPDYIRYNRLDEIGDAIEESNLPEEFKQKFLEILGEEQVALSHNFMLQ